MMIVLALGISRPLSMIVVQTRMSASWRMNLSITSSSSPFAHLAVADEDAGVGDELLNLIRHLDDVVHAVVDEIDLPLAIELAQDRLLHALLVVAPSLPSRRCADPAGRW